MPEAARPARRLVTTSLPRTPGRSRCSLACHASMKARCCKLHQVTLQCLRARMPMLPQEPSNDLASQVALLVTRRASLTGASRGKQRNRCDQWSCSFSPPVLQGLSCLLVAGMTTRLQSRHNHRDLSEAKKAKPKKQKYRKRKQL